jgi:hypothetical protein
MKPLHSCRTNDTPRGHPVRVTRGALLRRVVVLSTTRPASHRGIPSLPVPGRRRAPGVNAFTIPVLALAFLSPGIPSSPVAAGQELRWVAYVRADEGAVSGGSVEVVRSDGRRGRTLIKGGVQVLDLGPGGLVYAAREEGTRDSPPSGSVLTASVEGDVRSLYRREAETRYLGVSASSEGSVALFRQVTETPQIPTFLADGVGVLSSTNVPVLVPPEEPPGTGGLVPSAEADSYRVLFTNDPAGALAHAQQVNVFVMGSMGDATFDPSSDPNPDITPVRATEGRFFCGASVCFLSWQELDVTYTVGEFGTKADAVAFAESLVSMDALAGPLWRRSKATAVPTPQLIVRSGSGNEKVLQSVEGFCECAFMPLDWSGRDDRLLVLATAEGDSRLQEYSVDGSGTPADVGGDSAGAGGREVVLDAAYGPNGIVALFGGEGGPPGVLHELEGGRILARDVRAFDLEGSTLGYVSSNGDVIVRSLTSGSERTVGRSGLDVTVGPDIISGQQPSEEPPPTSGEGGVPRILLGLLVAAATLALGGVILFSTSKGRR